MSRRTPIVAGNWKMNGTLEQASALSAAVRESVSSVQGVEVVLCPPFTALSAVAQAIRGSSLLLGAQNAHWESKGAFTGEISVPMLKELGCRCVILGHSERRRIFAESDAQIRKKISAVIGQGLNAILCVGETLEQRQQGKTWEIVESQMKTGLEGLASVADRLVVAYEPVWAIGTGLNATSAQAQEIHGKIREWLKGRFGSDAADRLRLIYGGSVKPDNASELMGQPDVDGALVGGASLDAGSFAAIVKAASPPKEQKPCSTRSS